MAMAIATDRILLEIGKYGRNISYHPNQTVPAAPPG
jgi:hypothetical protein